MIVLLLKFILWFIAFYAVIQLTFDLPPLVVWGSSFIFAISAVIAGSRRL